MTLRKIWISSLLLSVSLVAAQAKEPKFQPVTQLTAEQAALVEKAVAREKVTIKSIQQRTPLVETYIQNMRPDEKLYAIPVSDQYMLGRVDFSKTFTDKSYAAKAEKDKGFLKGSLGFMTGMSKALNIKTEYVSTGFMQMMFVDPSGFDQQHYDFTYVRRDFLGSVRTVVFDVHPKPGLKDGRFSGRIWVEDQDGNIVRFNGTYSGAGSDTASPRYFHFDSWRMNLQQDVWLPVAIYVEETQRSDASRAIGFRAQTHFWGYSLKLPTHESDNASIKIDDVTDSSDTGSQDIGPLAAQRAWVSQAEENVLDRLVQAGLLAPPSDFDKVLEQVTNNIIIGNNIQIADTVHCRVMLTAPLESLAVGNTILISKGLIDVLPSEEGLASILAFELSHIVLGHHIDTRYAFNDRLLFPDESTFTKIAMQHSDGDNNDAAKKAVELLNGSLYKDKLPNAGLFYLQLQARSKELTGLNSARLGDGLLRPDGTPWLSELSKGSPKLDQDKLDQIAALPLGSRLKTDPWDDKVYMLNVKPVPLLNARDKMPLEVTPIILRLTRFDANAGQAPGAAPAAPAAAPAPSASAPTGGGSDSSQIAASK